MKYELIIVRYGEVALKGKATRKYFETTLIKNIKNALNKIHVTHKIKKEWGRIFVYTNQISESIDILQKIFGITTISPAFQTQSDIASMSKLSVNILKEELTEEKSFALRVTRTGRHVFSSQDVAVKIGNELVKATQANVNLTKPDFELFIEIRDENAYMFTEKIRGAGGLPLGTQGKVLALITNPESILAAWHLMRRGCAVVFGTTNKMDDKLLNSFISNWNVPIDILPVEAHGKNLYKKLNEIAFERNCDAIVTGHTLYENSYNALSDVKLLKKYIEYPVLYPLISMKTNEINQKCKEIGIQL